MVIVIITQNDVLLVIKYLSTCTIVMNRIRKNLKYFEKYEYYSNVFKLEVTMAYHQLISKGKQILFYRNGHHHERDTKDIHFPQSTSLNIHHRNVLQYGIVFKLMI